jgi:hypothetical protein
MTHIRSSLKKLLPAQFITSRRPSVDDAVLGPISRIRRINAGCVGKGSCLGVAGLALERGAARLTIPSTDAPGNPRKEERTGTLIPGSSTCSRSSRRCPRPSRLLDHSTRRR